MKYKLLLLLPFFVVSCSGGKDASVAIERSAAYMSNAQYVIVDECNNVSKVWGDAIHYGRCYVQNTGWEVIDYDNWYYVNTKNLNEYTYCSDFNEALKVYSRSERHKWMIGMADEQMDSCRYYLAQMSSPKKKQKEMCEQARLTFRALQALYDCAAYPSGSYQSYGADIHRKNDEFMMEFRKLDDMMRYTE